MGEGSFGRVLACVDESNKHAVAIKVVKGVPRYKEHAHAEAELLREILRCGSELETPWFSGRFMAFCTRFAWCS